MLIALTFPWAKSRKYSLSALIGSIEIDSELTDTEIIIVHGSLKKSIERISKKFDKIIICISFMTPDLKHIKNEIDSLSSLHNPIRKKLILIAGGPHPTGDPLGTLKMGFDIIVIGEGEKILRKIISKIKNNDSMEDLKGLAYQKNHQPFIKKSNDWINLDDFPAFAPLHRLFYPIQISLSPRSPSRRGYYPQQMRRAQNAPRCQDSSFPQLKYLADALSSAIFVRHLEFMVVQCVIEVFLTSVDT